MVRIAYSCISPGTEAATRSLSDSTLGLGLIRGALRQPEKVGQVLAALRIRGFGAMQALDRAPLVFGDGLRQAVAWYRAHEAWWRAILSGEYRAYSARQHGERIG